MHILGILIGLIGFIAIWYYRIKMLQEAAKDGKKVVETVANLPRKMRFKNKTAKAGLDVVDDPREAATILMLEIAQARGTLTANQEATIRGEIMHHFEFTEGDANELMTQAAWLSRNGGAAHIVVARMTDFVKQVPGMGDKELIDLDDMLITVSEAEGVPVGAQLDLISQFRQKAGIKL
ncbi:MAG: hypothetical protein AAFR74_07040 [Pseudomonadota bacterium]